MQPDEHLAHRRRESRVEREVGAAPVAARADGLELLEDRAAGLAHVRPDPLLEALAPEVEAGLALLRHHALHHVLGGDAGVIGAREPERVPAAHPLEAHQHVLHRVVEAVAHVQHRRHVGRRHHHDVALAGIPRVGAEEVGFEPAAVEVGLDGGRVVLGGERFAHAEAVESSGELKSSSPWTRMQLMRPSSAGDAAGHAGGPGALGAGGHPAVQFHRARRHRQGVEREVGQGRVEARSACRTRRASWPVRAGAGRRRFRTMPLMRAGPTSPRVSLTIEAGGKPEGGATDRPAQQARPAKYPASPAIPRAKRCCRRVKLAAMSEERTEIQTAELSRWIVLLGVILLGIVLYFWLAPRTEPVVHPVQSEALQ